MASHTRKRIRLGRRLRELREARGITLATAGAAIQGDGPKVSRQEHAKAYVSPHDLAIYFQLYEVPPDAQPELLDLLVQKRIRHWWQEFANDINSNLAEMIALEDDASEALEYQPNVIPGLLQTRDYASVIITTGFNAYGPDQVEALVTVREMRQRLLREDEPLTYHAIATEAALHFDVGGPDVMREQMRHLIAEMALPNVTFQIGPFSAGRLATQAAGFTIFKFEDSDDPDAAWMEGVGGMIPRDSGREIRLYNRLFDEIASAALSPDETAALLRERAESL
jgi:transcriptional regulator with XRE-family HTH domain